MVHSSVEVVGKFMMVEVAIMEKEEPSGRQSPWPCSNLQEIPRPVLLGGCSQEDFIFFSREWLRYVRHYEKVDANEISEQLLQCLDTALQKVVYRALEPTVDAFDINVYTITQDVLLMVIELPVEEVEKAVYDDLGGEDDTLYPTDEIGQIKEQAWWWLTRT